MFDNIGWSELLVLIIAGLFILGPERLPDAAAWLGRNVRKLREYATGARDQLRSEVGEDAIEEMRKPINELQQLRSFNPKRAVSRHLFDDVDTGNGHGGTPTHQSSGATKPNGHTPPAPSPRRENLSPGEKPPIDPDAT